MHITLSPQRRDDTLTLSKAGNVLTINGDELDLSQIPEGALVEKAQELHPFLIGSIENDNGNVLLSVILPHGPNPPEAVAFPQPIIDPPDGVVVLPYPTEDDNAEN